MTRKSSDTDGEEPSDREACESDVSDSSTDESRPNESDEPDRGGPALVPADSDETAVTTPDDETLPELRLEDKSLSERLRELVTYLGLLALFVARGLARDGIEWVRTEGVPAARAGIEWVRTEGIPRAREACRETAAETQRRLGETADKTDVSLPSRETVDRVPTSLLVLAAVGLVVVSAAAVVGPNAGGPPTSADGSGPAAGTPTPATPGGPSGETFDPLSDTSENDPPNPSNLNPLPESHTDALGADRAVDVPDPTIRASAGSQTLRSDALRGPEGELRLVLSDDSEDSGRWVSFGAGWLREETGEVPETVEITHESGETTHSTTHVRDGRVTFFIPHFSTNVVTFDSTVSVTGIFGEGSEASYLVRDPSKSGNPNVTLTGIETAEWDNVTAGTVPDGGTIDLSVAGNVEPTGPGGEPEIRITGSEETTKVDTFGSGDVAISVGGDATPRNATITFEGGQTESSTTTSGTGDGTVTVDGNTAPSNQTVVIEGNRKLFQESFTGVGDGSFSITGDRDPVDSNITFYGRESLTSETRSGSGDTSISIGGDTAPKNGVITFEGDESVNHESTTFGGSSGVSKTITVDGNIAPTNEKITVTGETTVGNRQTNSVVGSGTVDILGNIEPVGPSNGEPAIQISGNTQTSNGDESGTATTPGTFGIPSGNLEPTGPSNNEPRVTLSAISPSTTTTRFDSKDYNQRAPLIGKDHDNITFRSSFTISPQESGRLDNIQVYIEDAYYGDPGVVDVYIKQEGFDKDAIEGQKVSEWDATGSAGWQTIPTNGFKVTAGETYSIGLDNQGSGQEGWVAVDVTESPVESGTQLYDTDSIGDRDFTHGSPRVKWKIRKPLTDVSVSSGGKTVSFGRLDNGETKSKAINLPAGESSLSVDYQGDGSIDWSLTQTTRDGSEIPSVDIDGDGSAEVSLNTVLVDGETVTRGIPSLSSGSRTVSTGVSDGPLATATFRYDPRTATEDPSVDVNGDGSAEVSCSGVYPSGETCSGSVSLTTGSQSVELATTAGTADVTVSRDERVAVENPSVDVNGDGSADGSYNGILKTGDTGSVPVSSLSVGTNTVDVSTANGPSPSWTLAVDRVDHTVDPAIDVDGDGETEGSYAGRLGPSLKVTVPLSEVDLGSNGVVLSTTSGPLPEWKIESERVEHSENPSVTVNGTEVSVSQTLGPGETVTKPLSGALGPDDNPVTTGTTAGPPPSWMISYGDISYTENPTADVGGDGTPDASYTGKLAPGERVEVPVTGLTTGNTTVDVGVSQGPLPSWNLTYSKVDHPESILVDTDGDLVYDVSVPGPLGPSESVSKPLTDVNTSTKKIRVRTESLPVGVSLRIKERTETPDGELTYPNGSAAFSRLSAGSKSNITVPQSALVSGHNTIGVELDSPDPDAPDPRVGVNVSHSVADEQTVTYRSEVFTERYDVSRTYSAARSEARITVPWAANVVTVRDVRVSLNGSTPVRPPDSALSFGDGTHLRIDVVDVVENRRNVSRVPEGTTVRVVTNASRIRTYNSSISVERPTVVGNSLDSEIRLTEWGPDSFLGVGSTVLADRVHYTTAESYDTETDYSVIETDGTQKVFLPDATAGSQVTLRTLPVRVDPQRDSVRVRVPEELTNETRPALNLKPDRVVGETVEIEYVGGSDSVWFGVVNEENVVIEKSQGGNFTTVKDDAGLIVIEQVAPPDRDGDEGAGTLALSALGGEGRIIPLAGIFGLLAVVVGAGRSPDTARSVARSVASAAGGLLGSLPGPVDGETVESGVRSALVTVADATAAAAGTTLRATGLTVITAVGVWQADLINLGAELAAVAGVGGTSLVSLVVLREIDEFTTARWIAVVSAVSLVGLQATGSTDLIAALVGSRVFIIVALVVGYAVVQLVREYRANNGPNDDRPVINIRSGKGGDD